jgi:1-acyl-sn-glycerol-3-phosphate acyltransferase
MSKTERMPHHRFRMALYWFFKIYTRLVFRLKYEGLENVPTSGPAILVANHTSMADMLVISTAIKPWICWVAKVELFKSKLLGPGYSKLGCIPVDRSKTDSGAARGIIQALRNRQIIGIFPQGTRVKRHTIGKIRPHHGAIHFAGKTGVPVLPVAIDGEFGLFRKVRVVFGKPYRLGTRHHFTNEELDSLSIQLMQRIYSLIGQKYPLAAGGGEA